MRFKVCLCFFLTSVHHLIRLSSDVCNRVWVSRVCVPWKVCYDSRGVTAVSFRGGILRVRIPDWRIPTAIIYSRGSRVDLLIGVLNRSSGFSPWRLHSRSRFLSPVAQDLSRGFFPALRRVADSLSGARFLVLDLPALDRRSVITR